MGSVSNNSMNMNTANELLDKLILRQLHLIEEKMICEIKIESSINNGSFQLAKSRYIMGQSSVSTMRLPTDCSPEFEASIVCKDFFEEGTRQMKVLKNNGEHTVNPIRWFGVLVPQNLHKAQTIFENSINYVVECVNVQLQVLENLQNIEMLRKYINYFKK